MSKVTEIKSEQQLDEILKANKHVVIDFFATWCGPCMHFKPTFEKLSEKDEYSSIKFVSVNVDELDELSGRYGVQAMPTFKFISRGKEVLAQVGASPAKFEENLKELKAL